MDTFLMQTDFLIVLTRSDLLRCHHCQFIDNLIHSGDSWRPRWLICFLKDLLQLLFSLLREKQNHFCDLKNSLANWVLIMKNKECHHNCQPFCSQKWSLIIYIADQSHWLLGTWQLTIVQNTVKYVNICYEIFNVNQLLHKRIHSQRLQQIPIMRATFKFTAFLVPKENKEINLPYHHNSWNETS